MTNQINFECVNPKNYDILLTSKVHKNESTSEKLSDVLAYNSIKSGREVAN